MTPPGRRPRQPQRVGPRIEHVFESPVGFVHLSVRSYFSMKEGAFSPEELAERTAGLGMAAVALTDRDGLDGSARFAHACRQVDIRPVFGASVTVRTARRDH